MRIGIDARFFGPAQTGIGRYVERLVTHLERFDQHNEYVVFLRRPAWLTWEPTNHRWSKVLADERWYSVREQVTLPHIFHKAKLDLLHVPHFNVPLRYRGRYIVTIHDLILDQFPTERASTLGPLLFRAKFFAYQSVIRQAIWRSQAIITVSEHSKQDLIQRFGVKPDKITVTYESVDPMHEPVPLTSLTERGIQQPYILHVGNSYPHKNLERFLQGVKIAHQRGQKFQTVFVGKRDYFSQRLERLAMAEEISNVLFFGFASEAELAGLYQHAQAYFFPSMSEGFGLPGLEAMQAGVPLFASRATCLPEVFANAAHYFDPQNPADMADSIENALHDTLERQRLVQAGHERLKDFSWAEMAKQTLSLYERTHAR